MNSATYSEKNKGRLIKTISKFKHRKKKFIHKFNHSNNKSNHPFIKKLAQLNKNQITNLSSFDQRRIVFISLNGLYQTWKNCPLYILYTAILIMPLKREWIYEPYKYKQELSTYYITKCSIFNS